MEWFSGRLEITLNDGTLYTVYDVTVAQAQKEIDAQEANTHQAAVRSALYFPYPLSMAPTGN